MQHGRPADGEVHLRKALELNPHHTGAANNLKVAMYDKRVQQQQQQQQQQMNGKGKGKKQMKKGSRTGNKRSSTGNNRKKSKTGLK